MPYSYLLVGMPHTESNCLFRMASPARNPIPPYGFRAIGFSPIEGITINPIAMYAFIALTQRLKPMNPIHDLVGTFLRITLAGVGSLDIPSLLGAILLYINDWRGGAKRPSYTRCTFGKLGTKIKWSKLKVCDFYKRICCACLCVGYLGLEPRTSAL